MVETCDGCRRTDAQCPIRIPSVEMLGFSVDVGWSTTAASQDLHFHSRACMAKWVAEFPWPLGEEYEWPPPLMEVS